MAKGASEEEDNQRGRSAEKKIISAQQANAEGEDVSSELPSRVHMFPNRRRTGDSSKSDDRRFQCSSLGTNRLIDLPHGAGQGAVLAGVQPPIIGLNEDLLRLRHRVEKGKKALYDAAMKVEDLEAIVQGLQRTWIAITKKRK